LGSPSKLAPVSDRFGAEAVLIPETSLIPAEVTLHFWRFRPALLVASRVKRNHALVNMLLRISLPRQWLIRRKNRRIAQLPGDICHDEAPW
jgi:hypothetical protein